MVVYGSVSTSTRSDPPTGVPGAARDMPASGERKKLSKQLASFVLLRSSRCYNTGDVARFFHSTPLEKSGGQKLKQVLFLQPARPLGATYGGGAARIFRPRTDENPTLNLSTLKKHARQQNLKLAIVSWLLLLLCRLNLHGLQAHGGRRHFVDLSLLG